jgi:hypothetical protein
VKAQESARNKSQDVGIGRQDGQSLCKEIQIKHHWQQCREGSIPSPDTVTH